MEKSLSDQGMNHANISVDMQLHIVAQKIKWSEPKRFENVILHPGAMHTIMSLMGCIGNLMKGSGLDVLVGAAFKHLSSIMSGKSWVMSLWAFLIVT